MKLQKYLCAENGGGTIVVANRTKASGWETFRVSFEYCQFFSFSSNKLLNIIRNSHTINSGPRLPSLKSGRSFAVGR
jgi:hypothetical protein